MALTTPEIGTRTAHRHRSEDARHGAASASTFSSAREYQPETTNWRCCHLP
jgi:hypothetical protein